MSDMQSEIQAIAHSIWETLFVLPLATADGAQHREVGPLMTGCVQIDGAWNGAVMLQCPEPLAGRLAAELFQPQADLPSEDVQDTIGELTNMLAGNIKALLPQPSRISLPAVALGADYDLRVIGTHVVAAASFDCAGSRLVVTLLQGATPAEA